MINECLIQMCCMCVQLHMIKLKIFLIILYIFGSDFYHSFCSCLVLTLFFIVLSMFCIQKQVSEFLATRLATHSWVVSFGYSFGDSLTSSEFIQRLSRLTGDSSHDSPNHQTSKIIFLKDFLWETYFKLLSSSLKPLLQYFYIKTQPIWMVFHSINISKVILNSFHWFWLLDYVLESFCALGWDFHHKGRKNIIFVNFFCMRFVSFDDFLWMLAPCGKKNMY